MTHFENGRNLQQQNTDERAHSSRFSPQVRPRRGGGAATMGNPSAAYVPSAKEVTPSTRASQDNWSKFYHPPRPCCQPAKLSFQNNSSFPCASARLDALPCAQIRLAVPSNHLHSKNLCLNSGLAHHACRGGRVMRPISSGKTEKRTDPPSRICPEEWE